MCYLISPFIFLALFRSLTSASATIIMKWHKISAQSTWLIQDTNLDVEIIFFLLKPRWSGHVFGLSRYHTLHDVITAVEKLYAP